MTVKLMVDLGNSAIKWAYYDSKLGKLGPLEQFCYVEQVFNEVLIAAHWQSLTQVEEVWLSSVASPKDTELLKIWIKKHWQLQAEVVKTESQAAGVQNGYTVPLQLGVDRWLALKAAHHLYPNNNLCIVDCGSAITLDILTQEGQHQGGLIMPGLASLSQAFPKSLLQRLRQSGEFEQPNHSLLANNTYAGLTRGPLYAVIGWMNWVIEQWEITAHPTATPLQLILTGGDVPQLLPFMTREYHCHPELVLQGLALTSHEKVCVA